MTISIPKVLLTIICVIAVATSASAECAWVLWTQNPSYNEQKGNAPDAWTYVPRGGPDVFDNRGECEQALVRLDMIKLKALKDAKESEYKLWAEGVFYKCSPIPWIRVGRRGSEEKNPYEQVPPGTVPKSTGQSTHG